MRTINSFQPTVTRMPKFGNATEQEYQQAKKALWKSIPDDLRNGIGVSGIHPNLKLTVLSASETAQQKAIQILLDQKLITPEAGPNTYKFKNKFNVNFEVSGSFTFR